MKIVDVPSIESDDVLCGVCKLPLRGHWRHRECLPVALRGLACAHPRMRYCCPVPCGHLTCPDCGLAWDEGAEK